MRHLQWAPGPSPYLRAMSLHLVRSLANLGDTCKDWVFTVSHVSIVEAFVFLDHCPLIVYHA
jgi:hypothetical protein